MVLHLNHNKIIVLLLILICFTAAASYSNFIVSSNFVEKAAKNSKCQYKISYPILENKNKDLSQKINKAIYNFVSSYPINCPKKSPQKLYLIDYDIPSNSNNYLSIRWKAKDLNNIITRIDSLIINTEDGSLLLSKDILTPLARNLMPEIVKLSQNNLAVDTAWQQFLAKIEQRHIQFYISGAKWYIVFNPHWNSNKTIVEAELPKHLIKQ